MSLGLLFAGQGTQHPGMLPWLDDADPLVRRTAAALGVADWRQALGDAAWALRNRHVQILLTGFGLAAWARLAPRLPVPAAAAGYSVGELAAFCAAGVFEADTALQLAGQRADAMDRCAAVAPGGLLSVSGLQRAAVAALCARCGLALAIDIDAETAVLGGPAAALACGAQEAAGLGARATPLAVAVASHTPAMQPAAEAFGAALRPVALARPALPLFCNAGGERVHDAAQAARVLAAQIAQTVRWSDVLEAMHARRVSCVLEIGPGSALSAMWNRRFPEVPARSADEFRSADAVVAWVQRQALG